MPSMPRKKKRAANKHPLKRALDVLGRRWSGELLHVLLKGELSFVDLSDALTPITPRMLSRRLAEFENMGLVACRTERRPQRSYYQLACGEAELEAMFNAIRKWGNRL